MTTETTRITVRGTKVSLTVKETPNLDALCISELRAFYNHHRNGGNRGDLGLGGPGSRTTTKLLADYAINKVSAMACRIEGRIPDALEYEHICNSIYLKLPEHARW